MAIGVIFNFPGGTAGQYDEVCRALNNGQAAPLARGLARRRLPFARGRGDP